MSVCVCLCREAPVPGATSLDVGLSGLRLCSARVGVLLCGPTVLSGKMRKARGNQDGKEYRTCKTNKTANKTNGETCKTSKTQSKDKD